MPHLKERETAFNAFKSKVFSLPSERVKKTKTKKHKKHLDGLRWELKQSDILRWILKNSDDLKGKLEQLEKAYDYL